MTFEPIYFLYGILFIGTLLLVEGVYYFLREGKEGPQQTINRRMQMISDIHSRKAVLNRLVRSEQDAFSRGIAGIFPALERLITQAGVIMPLSRLALIMVMLGGGIFAVLALWSPLKFFLSVPLGIALGIALPLLFLRRKRRKRVNKFGEQLPNVLDLIVRSLRAGHPVATSLGLVAKDMADPAGTEFGIVVDEMTYGLDIHGALRNMSERIPHDDLQFLIVSIQVQYSVGGNLAEVLANLSQVIRLRFQMIAKIHAITAEGRMSAMVVGGLPFGVAALISVINPDYYAEVADDRLFLPLFIGAFSLFAVGQAVLWRMVNPRF